MSLLQIVCNSDNPHDPEVPAQVQMDLSSTYHPSISTLLLQFPTVLENTKYQY